MDNCDTDVNITLFTETEGYIPTDAIRNYCAPATPEAQSGSQTCDDRAPEALRLFNFPGADDSFVMSSESENLVQVMADGSLSIAMEVENADGTGGFILSAEYGAGQDWTTWEAGGSNYKCVLAPLTLCVTYGKLQELRQLQARLNFNDQLAE